MERDESATPAAEVDPVRKRVVGVLSRPGVTTEVRGGKGEEVSCVLPLFRFPPPSSYVRYTPPDRVPDVPYSSVVQGGGDRTVGGSLERWTTCLLF